MTNTANLNLPFIDAAQAQKHVTHNQALNLLDLLVQAMVLDRTLTSAPASPADGARYIVAAGATGIWAGHANAVAAFQDGAWSYILPQQGWLIWIANESRIAAWSGSAWIVASLSSVNPVALVGVNATADTTNRFTVKSDATLFDNVGAGHQAKLNKAAAGNTASFLFQTGFSGRAEMGLVGDDNFHFKVSADGSTWREAMVIDSATGVVTLPFTEMLIRTSAPAVSVDLPLQPAQYNVAALPAAATALKGAVAFALNGRKVGEGAGSGTGIMVYCTGSSWRTFADAVVAT